MLREFAISVLRSAHLVLDWKHLMIFGGMQTVNRFVQFLWTARGGKSNMSSRVKVLKSYRKLTLDSTVVNLRTNCCNFVNLCILQTYFYVLFYSYLNEQWPIFFFLCLSCVQPVCRTLCDIVQQHVLNFQRQSHRTTSDPHYKLLTFNSLYWQYKQHGHNTSTPSPNWLQTVPLVERSLTLLCGFCSTRGHMLD